MNFSKIQATVKKVSPLAQLVEIGFEELSEQHIELLQEYIKNAPLPVILKPISRPNQKETEYLHLIGLASSLIPAYLDIAIESLSTKEQAFAIIEKIKRQYPSIKIILSYHNLEKCPEDFEILYQSLQHNSVHFYKIAVHVTNTIQALKILNYSKNKKDLILLGLGPFGKITRILSPIINNPINYCCLEANQPIAPGQMSLDELTNTFGYLNLSEKTAIYCLIGNPTQQSISHITHNYFFQKQNIDAVYIKMDVSAEELPIFLEEAVQIPFRGISVTTPLKKATADLISDIKSLPVNTLRYENMCFTGISTDGLGALSALGFPTNKKVAVIGGTGGAGMAIVKELYDNDNDVTIITRNIASAPDFPYAVHFRQISDESPSEPYDILINCSPVDFPVPKYLLKTDSVVMDIKTLPKMTLFLSEAQKMGCKIIHGLSLFANQAIEQFKFWNLPIETFEKQFVTKVEEVVDNLSPTHE